MVNSGTDMRQNQKLKMDPSLGTPLEDDPNYMQKHSVYMFDSSNHYMMAPPPSTTLPQLPPPPTQVPSFFARKIPFSVLIRYLASSCTRGCPSVEKEEVK